MTEYRYNVSGIYKDWCMVEKNGEVIHEGSVFILDEDNGDLLFQVNHTKYEYQESNVRKWNDLYITVPKTPDCKEPNYIYVVCIFTFTQFYEMVDITYLDHEYTENVAELSVEELLRVWIYSNNELLNCDKFDSLLPNVISFSNTDISVEVLSDILEMKYFEIISRPVDGEIVTAFVDIDNEIYEWNCLIYSDNEMYLNIDSDYSARYISDKRK